MHHFNLEKHFDNLYWRNEEWFEFVKTKDVNTKWMNFLKFVHDQIKSDFNTLEFFAFYRPDQFLLYFKNTFEDIKSLEYMNSPEPTYHKNVYTTVFDLLYTMEAVKHWFYSEIGFKVADIQKKNDADFQKAKEIGQNIVNKLMDVVYHCYSNDTITTRLVHVGNIDILTHRNIVECQEELIDMMNILNKYGHEDFSTFFDPFRMNFLDLHFKYAIGPK